MYKTILKFRQQHSETSKLSDKFDVQMRPKFNYSNTKSILSKYTCTKIQIQRNNQKHCLNQHSSPASVLETLKRQERSIKQQQHVSLEFPSTLRCQ